MDQEKAKKLIEKYLNGNCTPQEKALLERFYLEESRKPDSGHPNRWEQVRARVWKKTWAGATRVSVTHSIKRYRTVAAAIAIIGTVAAALYLNSYIQQPEENAAIPIKEDIEIFAGGNKAVLTLADGSRITLDGASSVEIPQQGKMELRLPGDGKLVYSTAVGEFMHEVSAPAYNKIETPRGGQYQVTLPDGTKVWLNAASSLRYPLAFNNRERRVELSGEGYFEVAQQHKVAVGTSGQMNPIPFIVETPNQEIEVLGTHFNINAYTDEPDTKTTLLEGSVRVSALHTSILLSPGEQARFSDDQLTRHNVDPEYAVAWKNGLFQFKNTDIRTAMRQFSRWYNVEVEFEREVPSVRLWGEAYRNVNAAEILEILRYFNIRYRIVQNGNQKKVIIT